MTTNNNVNEYDRKKELEEFNNSKRGVKGLVDSGITRIPRMFHYPVDSLSDIQQKNNNDGSENNIIPIIDMRGPHEEVVKSIREACAKFGFFQVVNHGVSVALMDRVINAVKSFHELQEEEKMVLYDLNWSKSEKGVSFYSNHDLFYSKAASWRDSLHLRLGPGLSTSDPSVIPRVCRDAMMEWEREVTKLGNRLMGLLSNGLGLSTDRLTRPPSSMAGHYYPHCPEPTKTIGTASHTDIGILAILLRDQLGGLQVKYNGNWINLQPVHGGLVINIGDLFQIMSNNIYTSGEHRVVANPFKEPGISVAVFFNPHIDDGKVYGPLPELVSEENPALYKRFTYSDLMTAVLSMEMEYKAVINHFRL